MVFVELTPFEAFRDEYWTDDDLRALQSFLLVSPEAGALSRGGAGLSLTGIKEPGMIGIMEPVRGE